MLIRELVKRGAGGERNVSVIYFINFVIIISFYFEFPDFWKNRCRSLAVTVLFLHRLLFISTELDHTRYVTKCLTNCNAATLQIFPLC